MMKDLVVLKRTMFSEKLPKSVRNSGIMAGFEDDDMLEAPEKEDEMPVMARTPQNPEILMNNLRGDMRSVDARYQELAQMVGDEAAMETPPEVLAMLQMQFGQQQEGIGALPQGAEMMPPPMGGGAPMGAPGGAPAMPSPQGAMPPQGMPAMPPQGAMPLGMEGAGPFPQGGAEQAPQQFNKGGLARRRGDDLRPLEGGGGSGGGGYSSPGFSSAAARPPPLQITPAGQAFLAKPPSMFSKENLINKMTGASDYLKGIGRSSQNLVKDLDQYLGYRFMAPQPTVTRMTGGTPINLTQGRNTLVKDPATGVIVPGKGTQFAPFTAMGPLRSPTFTQGFVQGVNRLVVEYPRVAALLPPALLTAAGIAGINLTEEQRSTPLTPEEQAKYDETMAQIDAVNRPSPPVLSSNQLTPQQIERFVTQSAPAVEEEVVAKDDTTDDTTDDFIEKNLVQPKKLSRIERIKAAQSEYDPLFKELLGDTKQDARTNAFLLLADAGFKLASTYKPTFAMAASEAAKDIPRGLAAIAAQQKDRDVKVKTAALTQAITDVTAEDAARRAREDKLLDMDTAVLVAQAKAYADQYKGKQVLNKRGEAGLIFKETKDGDFLGVEINPNDPFVQSVLGSEYRHNENRDPFVKNIGNARTAVVSNDKQRLEIVDAMGRQESILAITNELKDIIKEAYSPGTFVIDKVNKVLVPIAPNAVLSPNIEQEAVLTKIKLSMNSLIKLVATADRGGGRLSNYAEQIERLATDGFNNPAGFLENAEIAATGIKTLETNALNGWNQNATRLGIVKFERVRSVPNLGTANDPFVLSGDAKEQAVMFDYLGNSFGQVKDPNAKIYLDMGPLGVKGFTPAEIKQKAGLK
jgi:hypothetical protein